MNKFANPLSGETYEVAGNGWEYVSEQVSHHPPITAVYWKHDLFEIHGNTHMRLTFTGKNIEVILNQLVLIDLINPEKGINERYEINFPKNSVYNLLFGKLMTFNHYGDVICKNWKTNDTCVTKVHPCTGMFMKERDKA